MVKNSAFRPLFLTLLLAASRALAGDPIPVVAVRVALPAQVKRGGELQTLMPRTVLEGGDHILTGPHGRAALQLAGLGLITLGADADLFVHSAELPASGALARLQLMRGALRLDARPKGVSTAQDFRLNAGGLRMRVYGAEVWIEVTSRGQNVCLLQGALEILRDDGDDRIDNPGDCLLYSGNGRKLLVKPDEQETLARKLVRTAFAEDYTTRLAAEDSPAPPPPPAAEPAPLASAQAPPPPVLASAPADVSAGHGWTVVAASMPDSHAAASEAAHLVRLGLPAEVRSGDGHQRVTLGSFATAAQAREFANQVHAKHGLVNLWLLRY